MIDGVVLTVVGMLTVFLFLVLLVVSMVVLRAVVDKWFPERVGGDDRIAAIAVAAVRQFEQAKGQGKR
ncbi:MAG: hypothetical protein EA382_17275 [Spirochaetaceae bacterium]|nr:MAG: hypothetical protein EA382_17275 [Spirochaetaceae bacterium]